MCSSGEIDIIGKFFEVHIVSSMSSNTSPSEISSSNTCANCGKEGSEVTNTCNKCKSVMYCNAVCKKRHRHKHKNECERRVAELHDEKLFKQPPPLDDCPICMVRLPNLGRGIMYMACCGKMICTGCTHAPVYDDQGNIVPDVCPFCRSLPFTSNEEAIERYEKRMELNDAQAIQNMGGHYSNGSLGLLRDHAKAFELFHRAGELGNAESHYIIAGAYRLGEGVERDEEKAKHYYELAAMGGSAKARHNLGAMEANRRKAGNKDRALKHFMIAVKDGNLRSLEIIKEIYKCGFATKDDYATTLRSYRAYIDEIKSDQRDEAVAFSDEYKYYESSI